MTTASSETFASTPDVPDVLYITVNDVLRYVREQPNPEAVVGYCKEPGRCLIAKTILAKYGESIALALVIYGAGPGDENSLLVDAYTHEQAGRHPGIADGTEAVAPIKTYHLGGFSGVLLARLARRFDQLGAPGHPVTREQALAAGSAPAQLSLTVEEVRAWVEGQPLCSVVASCQRPSACLIARTIQEKYAAFFGASVAVKYMDSMYVMVTAHMPLETGIPAREREQVYTLDGAEGARLAQLAGRFDSLGGYGYPVTREEALTLFV